MTHGPACALCFKPIVVSPDESWCRICHSYICESCDLRAPPRRHEPVEHSEDMKVDRIDWDFVLVEPELDLYYDSHHD